MQEVIEIFNGTIDYFLKRNFVCNKSYLNLQCRLCPFNQLTNPWLRHLKNYLLLLISLLLSTIASTIQNCMHFPHWSHICNLMIRVHCLVASNNTWSDRKSPCAWTSSRLTRSYQRMRSNEIKQASKGKVQRSGLIDAGFFIGQCGKLR